MFIIACCKREEYINAWHTMYLEDKSKYNDNPLFDGINPALNKTALASEVDNFCTVAYDSEVPFEGFIGKPVGIFSFVVTKRKIIGKQFIVDPEYQRKGLGQALLIENEKTLIDNKYDKYYIGCSSNSAQIFRKHWKIEPFSEDIECDLFKFNVDLNRENFNELYENIITNNPNIEVKYEINQIKTNTKEELKDVIEKYTSSQDIHNIDNEDNSQHLKGKKKSSRAERKREKENS